LGHSLLLKFVPLNKDFCHKTEFCQHSKPAWNEQ